MLTVVSQEQIEAWKVKYGSIFKIPLETGETVYVRSPKIKEIEACQSLLQQGKFITYNISLFKTCFLGGDDVLDDERKLMAASSMMMQTVETVTASLEKL